MNVAQTWHKREPVHPEPVMSTWKASEYRDLRAVAVCTWRLVNPFDSYRPSRGAREIDAGAHAHFLRLRELMLGGHEQFEKACDVFASAYGLLGLFHHPYSPMIMPPGKHLISPEAVVEGGRLRTVNPETGGIELLREIYNEPWARYGMKPFTDDALKWVAMPDEVRFGVRDRHALPHPAGNYLIAHELHPWEEVRRNHDALFVMNKDGTGEVSILCRREDIRDWEHRLGNLLIPSDDPEHKTVKHARTVAKELSRDLIGVSPTPAVDDEGRHTQGWRCNTLLQAMSLMTYLDATGGAQLRKCGCHDCPNHYRPGPRGSKYCSPEHASRASTRLSRGQLP